MPKLPKFKILIASTVYHFEDQLEQICAVLSALGYQVWNSHLGTMPVDPSRSNRDNCIAAVGSCDAFVGIIRPYYGTGIVGPRSITHEECLEAVRLQKPRWFLVHRDVVVARQLLKPYMYKDDGSPDAAFTFRKTAVMDDVRVIDLYNVALQSELPVAERKGHWVQEFHRLSDVLTFVNSQFQDAARIRGICKDMRA